MKILGAVILVVVGLLVAAAVYVDTIAKAGIERGASYAMGVPTGVSSVSLGLASGDFGLSELTVSNPEGFETPHFIRLGRARLALPVTRLLDEQITAPLLELEGIDVNIEKSGKRSNYGSILTSLKRLQSAAPAAEGSSPGKTFVIENLVIRDVSAHLRMASLPGESGKIDVRIPEIRLANVGGEQGAGVLLSELTAIVTNAVLRAVMQQGVGLPKDILGELGTQLAGLGSVRFEASGALTERGGAALRDLADGLSGEGESLGEKAKGMGDRLKGDLMKGLLGGKDADREAPSEPSP